jgi:predicted transcriptional regulator
MGGDEMREFETYGEEKAYELEALLAKVTQRELDKSGLTLKEFAKVKGISRSELKHAILCNLEDFNCGNDLKYIAKTFHKLGYDLKFVLVDKSPVEEPPF